MMKEILIPTKCPECQSTLEIVNEQLFCRNLGCSAKLSKQVEHYVKVLGILGFGPKTIEKLEVSSPVDLYRLSMEDYIDCLGEKMGAKLYTELHNKSEVEFEKFLAAAGIPLIGGTASAKLGAIINSIEDITEQSCKEASIGPKATNNLLQWKEGTWEAGLSELSKYVSITAKNKNSNASAASVKVVITGKLNDFKNRTLAAKYLEDYGIATVSSVSKTVDYLVSEEGRESSSVQKARKLNIPIVSIPELLDIVNTQK